MRRFITLIAIAAAVTALVGCSQPTTTGDQTGTPSPATTTAAPAAPTGPVASAIWTDTLAGKTYQSWTAAPGFETTQAAKGPHGKMVRIFVDPTVASALGGTGATEFPVGATIVKDAYDAAGSLMQVEYMQKTDTGWYFASFGVDGTVNKEGVKVEPCQTCHAKGSDSVMSFKLP